MRIRARPSRRRVDRIALNLASMIDVTFLLLIYFMVTMILQDREDHLSPTLKTERRDASGAAVDFQPQRIEVLAENGREVYRLGRRVLGDRGQLAAALEPLPKSVGVFVVVHGGVSVGHAVSAVQIARDAGFEQVTYVPATK